MSTYIIVSFVATPEIILYEVIRISHYAIEGIIRNPLGEQYRRKMHRCTAANGTQEQFSATIGLLRNEVR